MSYYFCKLVPPRADFAQTLSEAEMAAMMAHAQYWQEKAKEKIAVVVGLVGDPKGFYGMGVLEVTDENQLQNILDNDPVIKANLGLKYEHYILPRGVIQR